MLTPNAWRPTEADTLELVDGPPEHAIDLVPSINQDEPVATYQDWNKSNTKVIACRINNNVYPGELFTTRDEAYASITARFGRIVEANYVPGRAFFRVMKVKP